jgi:hypothetical protein
MKARIVNICLFIIVSLALLLPLGSCKNFGVPDFELKIEIKEGAQGTPPAGEYVYNELEVIEYQYTPKDDQHFVEVLVNGSRWLSSGSFTMYTDLEVVVQIIDIRGTWAVTLEPPSDEQDTEDVIFNITFDGAGLLSGDFTDDRGYSGAWKIEDITLTITYADWLDYVLTGDITVMRGTWSSLGKTGPWDAVRQ